MPRIVVINHLTLDGVMQAPGRRDEDTRDGFEHGGWASSRISEDDVIVAAMGARMLSSSGRLLGRRTYDDLLSYWNSQDSPFKDALNDAPKYVASLIKALIRHDLVDEYLLLIHPVVLGSGRRLVPGRGAPVALRLVTVHASPGGVLITTYEPARAT